MTMRCCRLDSFYAFDENEPPTAAFILCQEACAGRARRASSLARRRARLTAIRATSPCRRYIRTARYGALEFTEEADIPDDSR